MSFCSLLAGSGGIYTGYPGTPTESICDSTRSRTVSVSGRTGGRAPVPRIIKWARSNNCFECEEPFNLFVRRHHCRMCGNSFCHGTIRCLDLVIPSCNLNSCLSICAEHSSRRVSLFGIGFDEEPVRVCDTCFAEYYACAQPEPSYTSPARYPYFGAEPLSTGSHSHTSAA